MCIEKINLPPEAHTGFTEQLPQLHSHAHNSGTGLLCTPVNKLSPLDF